MKKGGFLRIEKGGRFKTGQELQSAMEQVLAQPLKQAGLKVIAVAMANTPVVSGNMRRNWTTSGEPEWQGTVYMIRVGNATIYLKRVNATSKQNAGFVEKSVTESKEDVLDIIRKGLSGLKSQIWAAVK